MEQKYEQSILSLWAVGVGATIGGDFFGFQPILQGGIIIALLSVAVCSVVFLAVGHSVSELTRRLHFCCQNGSVARVSLVLGEWWGMWSACFSLLKVHNVLCVLMVGMSGYILSLLDLSEDYQFVMYPVLYLIFYAINCQDAEMSSMQQIVITIFCMIVLVIYYSIVGTNLNFEAYALPYVKTSSISDIIASMPYGCTLFLGFEEIPLLVTSTKFTDDVAWRVSRSILYSYVTLTFFGFLTVILSAASSPGLEAVSDSNVPLLEGLKDAIRSNSLHPYYNGITSVMSVCFVLALACPTISFTMYTGKFIEQLAESKSRGGMGLLPSWLIYHQDPMSSSSTHSRSALLSRDSAPRISFGNPNGFGVPHYSLWLACVVGTIQCCLFGLIFGINTSGRILISASLLPALLDYVIQLQCLYAVVTNSNAELELFPIIEEFDETEAEVDEDIHVTIFLLRFAQTALVLLVICLWYTAIVVDATQRIGIVIFAVTALILLYIFKYNRNHWLTSRESVHSKNNIFIRVK